MKLTKLFAAAAVALGALAPMASHASLILTIDDLSTAGVDLTVVDGALNDLSSGNNGQIVYVGSVGNWSFNATSALGVGTTDIFGIDLNTLSVSSRTGGTLRITLTETDLTYNSSGLLNITSGIGGTTNGSVSFAAYADDSNAAFGKAVTLFSGTGSGGAFSQQSSMMTTLVDPFSLTLQVDITHTGSQATSLDFSSQVPEPGSLALLSVALLGAGAAVRRRKN